MLGALFKFSISTTIDDQIIDLYISTILDIDHARGICNIFSSDSLPIAVDSKGFCNGQNTLIIFFSSCI